MSSIGFIFMILLMHPFFGNQYTEEYSAALIDKVDRLKEKQQSKIILVGNSNLAFDIDSKAIEKKLGMPVVNLGLHGGLGNTFHENTSKINIAEGDIVIVCHTDYGDDGKISDKRLA